MQSFQVYTVVNIQSGQLLAMKEIGLGIGDRRAIDRAANELQILEDVVHPNLVRYYGVEIYRVCLSCSLIMQFFFFIGKCVYQICLIIFIFLGRNVDFYGIVCRRLIRIDDSKLQ